MGIDDPFCLGLMDEVFAEQEVTSIVIGVGVVDVSFGGVEACEMAKIVVRIGECGAVWFGEGFELAIWVVGVVGGFLPGFCL